MEQDQPNNNWFNSLPRWLPTIVLMVSLLVSWGGALVKFSSLEEEVASMKTELKASDSALTTLLVNIAEIKTSLKFIEEKVK